MDHAEAHERIADLSLEPARLERLNASEDAQDIALREHVNDCPRCRAELAEWRRLHSAVTDALAGKPTHTLEPIAPPADLRRRVLVLASQAAPRERRRGLVGRTGLLALAAVIALLAAGVGVVFVRDQSDRLARASLEHAWLSQTVAAMNRVLATPDHQLVALRTADGTAAGSIAWSQHDLVVLAGSLPAPAADQVYRCWLSYDGKETAMGSMWFVDSDAFWVDSTAGWAEIDLSHDRQFLVTLEPIASGSTRHTGPVVLSATLDG